jgi:hypothetical protein
MVAKAHTPFPDTDPPESAIAAAALAEREGAAA